MKKIIMVLFLVGLYSPVALCTATGATRAMSGKLRKILMGPIISNPTKAEQALGKAFENNSAFGYRLALCKFHLKRDMGEVLRIARIAAENDRNGIAQYFFGVLLERNGSQEAQTWYHAAGNKGIGWEEFARDEQFQLNGH